MKPLHAKWTAESLEYAATQDQWMENAFRGVGIWDILQGTFIPDPLLKHEFWQPEVATAEEAALDQQDSDSEYEFVENSDDEVIQTTTLKVKTTWITIWKMKFLMMMVIAHQYLAHHFRKKKLKVNKNCQYKTH